MPPGPSEPRNIPRARKRTSTGRRSRRATIAATTPRRRIAPTSRRRCSTEYAVAACTGSNHPWSTVHPLRGRPRRRGGRLLLPGADLVRPAGGAADHEQRRRRRCRLEPPLRLRLAGDDRARRELHLLAVEGGHRLAAVDEVELLLAGVHLVVLGDENCARVLRDGVDAEGGDAEVVADRLPGGRPVSLDGRDVVEDGDLP